MEIKDYYRILGVERTASAKEIKFAYLSLIKKYHPDKSSKHINKFQEIVEAYNILGDLDYRLRYSFVMSQNKYNRIKWAKRFGLPINYD